MPHRSTRNMAWISALLALFMVLVLPACWYGALERAHALGQAAPSSSNNNEEREEHEEHEAEERAAMGRRPPPSGRTPAPRTVMARVFAPPASATLVASAAPVPKSHVLTVRRLN